MKIFSILLLVTTLSSCSVFEEDDITRPIPVDSISVKNILSLTADFTASNFCGSMCWAKTYFEKTINGNNVYIKTFAVVDGSKICPDVCVYAETPVSISLPSAGSYVFHFWRSDSTSIDTTLIIGI
jgi:hypothetical protein